MVATLIGTSHGTHDPAGQAAVRGLLDAVRAARPEIDVREAFVDVQQPEVGQVLAEVLREADAVVVPLLLSTGFHMQFDIARAVEDVKSPAGHTAIAAEPLGPHPLLVKLLADRCAAAEATCGPWHPDDAVVLAAAGSSVAAAAIAVEEMASALSRRLGIPVMPAYGAGAQPRVPVAVELARSAGAARVIVVPYLLAPGYFLDQVREAGADVVTDPLVGAIGTDQADPLLVQVVLDRYDAAVSV